MRQSTLAVRRRREKRRPSPASLLVHSGDMSKRLIVIVCSVALAGILVIGIFLVFRKTPPRAARLLPEADAVVYLDVRPFRLATHFDRDPVTHSPEFQRFMDATGFVPERDLDSAGFALQQMADPSGPNGPVAYSEVLIGHFDGNRIARYLASLASHQEVYGTNVIFDIPVEGRIVPRDAASPRHHCCFKRTDTRADPRHHRPESIRVYPRSANRALSSPVWRPAAPMPCLGCGPHRPSVQRTWPHHVFRPRIACLRRLRFHRESALHRRRSSASGTDRRVIGRGSACGRKPEDPPGRVPPGSCRAARPRE